MQKSENKPNTKILAVCGKGGVGKTSVSAMITRELTGDASKKVLAIDADPAVGLATVLGFQGKKSVDDIRNDLIQKVERGNSSGKEQIITMLDYELFDALEERENLAFLAIGRSEKEGCYCRVNELLKDIILNITKNFDYVIIDGEAGVEQINRRVLDKVTHLVLVSDASFKGINVVKTIKEVAANTVTCQRAGLILNRIKNEDELAIIKKPGDIELLGWLPEDEILRKNDIEGKSIFEMPDTYSLKAIKNCLRGMGILSREGGI